MTLWRKLTLPLPKEEGKKLVVLCAEYLGSTKYLAVAASNFGIYLWNMRKGIGGRELIPKVEKC